MVFFSVLEPNRCRYEGELRLANQTGIFSGTDEYLGEAGRIEVCFTGVWGLVCDLNWREEDAQVACRHFGYSSPQFSKSYDISRIACTCKWNESLIYPSFCYRWRGII